MSLISTLSLFVFTATFTIFVQSRSSVLALSTNDSSSCPSYQTDCGSGCCPFAEGVCCIDGIFCCQHGQTCIPYVGFCIGLVKDSKTALGLSVNSTKATPIKNLVTACPPNTTDCGEGLCCPFPNAVCCGDGTHCCPDTFVCDLQQKECVTTSINSTKSFPAVIDTVSVTKSIKKSPYKTCPGNNKICPIYSSCCILDSGDWGCCPNPSIKNFKMANDSLSCTTNQTPCTMGCCPFAEGVCCADGYECCQHGQACAPFGLCIGLMKNPNAALGFSLDSTEATPVKSLVTACPIGFHECSDGGCCFNQCACCGEYCCFPGFTCDGSGNCVL